VIFGQWLLGENLPGWATESRTLPTLNSFGDGLISALPDDLEERVTDILQRGVSDALDGAEDLPAEEGTDAGETELTEI
jgi:membrane protein required for colicin V production